MNKKALKVLLLVFGIICFLLFVAFLGLAINLPRTVTYKTALGTLTERRSGYFDSSYLSPILISAIGAFWGIALFFLTKKEERNNDNHHHCHCRHHHSDEVIDVQVKEEAVDNNEEVKED